MDEMYSNIANDSALRDGVNLCNLLENIKLDFGRFHNSSFKLELLRRHKSLVVRQFVLPLA